MRIRHRIPSVFSLSMVDVMCCALGCVILLWLLNLKKAKDTEDETLLNQTKLNERITDADTRIAAADAEIADRKAALARLEHESSDLKGALARRDARILYLTDKLRKEEERVAKLEEVRTYLAKQEGELTIKLTANEKQVLELLAKLDVSEKKLKALEPTVEKVPMLDKQLKATQLRLTELQKESEGRAIRLDEALRGTDDLRAERGALELALKRRTDELATARTFESKWNSGQDELALLRKDLAAGRLVVASAARDLEEARGQKRALESDIFRIRQAADNRFAGITLTGRRVIFLIDMSGSMDLIDEKTPAPDKWSSVRIAIGKVMRSLPDLEKFQVVVFSKEAKFLLGKDGQWLDYDEKTSAKQVEDALAATKPAGGTNMYAAVDAAFRYRPFGLDTIYLFSDGLPNTGEGVPADEAERLLRSNREGELSERLSKHIRNQLKTTWNRPADKERVRINSVGFFYESPDVGAFLWALSRENDGSFVGMSKP